MTAQGKTANFESALSNPFVTFTRLSSSSGLLTKTVQPDRKGGIIKTPAAQMTAGTAETVTLPFAEFGPYMRTFKPNQALCHGITDYDRVNVASSRKFTGKPDTITRSKDFFKYSSGWGLGMLDYDPKSGQTGLTRELLIDAISSVWPEFRALPKWWTPSTSACIYDQFGNQLTDEGSGFHLYFPFTPASKLPELSEVLFKRLWLAGYGYIFVTRAGSLLPRTIFDASIFSQERLDFVAGAYCIDCEQRLPDPVYFAAEEMQEMEA